MGLRLAFDICTFCGGYLVTLSPTFMLLPYHPVPTKVILLLFLLLYIVLALYKVYSCLLLLLFNLGRFVCVMSGSTVGFCFIAL